MSVLTSQGDLTDILAADVATFDDVQGMGFFFFVGALDSLLYEFYSGNYAVLATTPTSVTADFGPEGIATVTGTGLTADRMTVTAVSYDSGSGEAFEFTGSVQLSTTGYGSTSFRHIETTIGTDTFIMDGSIRITNNGFSGNATRMVAMTGGITVEYIGNLSLDRGTGSFSKITISDANGSVSVAGNYQADAWYFVVDNAATVADVFAAPSLFTAADTINVGDSSYAWHGFGGNDKLIGDGNGNEMFGDDGNDTLTGNGGADTLTGGIGDDSLDGGAGDDTMTGGTGNDKYFVDSFSDVIVEQSGEGTETVYAAATFDMNANAQNAEILILTGTGSNAAVGNGSNNTITGNAGNNSIDGGAGADKMAGGAGNDTYVVDDAGDTVTETTGIDLVQSSITYTLGTNVEALELTGSGNLNGTGNTGINTITGNTGSNTLNGGTGADTLIGGDGDDFYVVDNTGDVVSESSGGGFDTVLAGASYTLGAEIENLTLTGTRAANGTGNADNNTISGNSGVNTLDGGGGLDTLAGGFGNDVYLIHDGNTSVVEAASAGTDTVRSDIDYALDINFENLVLLGGARIGTGNASANTITGTAGNDTLDGGGEIDKLISGFGDDIYYVDNARDTVSEGAGGGTDTVYSIAGSFTLSAYVENLFMTGGAMIGIGSAVNNIIDATGTSVVNTLSGMGGNDTLDGGVFSDTLTGGTGADIFNFSATDGFADIVTDFSRTQGDKIHIDDLLGGYNPITDNIADFVRIDNSGTNALLSVDADGTLNGVSFTLVATVNRVDLALGDLDIVI
ncbi:MAG: type I secretion C-terminal target domain-containing protein [bacterium]|nr:type I secretion C-terminal target domain-containing protein [bacterium]